MNKNNIVPYRNVINNVNSKRNSGDDNDGTSGGDSYNMNEIKMMVSKKQDQLGILVYHIISVICFYAKKLVYGLTLYALYSHRLVTSVKLKNYDLSLLKQANL